MLKFLYFALIGSLLFAGCRSTEFHTLEKQGRRGDAQAQYELGQRYRKGTGVETNLAAAVKWYKASAEQGFAKAQHALGSRYENGEGVEQDWANAARWYRSAAEKGYASSQCNLGYCYEKGLGVEENLPEAVRLYQLSADQSNKVAQANLGYCYLKGRGVKKDLNRSAEWYRKSAEQGYARGQYSLGLRYLKGEGVEKDPVVAVEWIRKAAEQDYPSAVVSMVYKYEKGIGVPEDLEEANRWYAKALTLGYTRDLKKVEALKDYSTLFAENDARIRAVDDADPACTNYVQWMKAAVECKDELRLPGEIDPWLEELSTTFSNRWKILHAVAMGYDEAADCRGYDFDVVVGSTIAKGNVTERNRLMSLLTIDRAYRLMMQNPPSDAEQSQLIRDYLLVLIEERANAHLLQLKTTDYTQEEVANYQFGQDVPKELIFYNRPASYEAAASDGELVRWLLGQQDIVFEDVILPREIQQAGFAAMLTMSSIDGMPHPVTDGMRKFLFNLADDEMVEWNKNEPKAVRLPEDYVYIPVFEKMARSGSELAAYAMSSICKYRYQLERAAEYFEMAGDTNEVRSIRANQGTIDACPPQAAGLMPEIDYHYRNGTEVDVALFRIHAGTNLLARLKRGEVMHSELDLLLGDPEWFRKTDGLSQPGMLEEVQHQTVPLEPGTKHFDQTQKIVFQPLEAGNYLVRAQMKDGNQAETILNIYDSMIYSTAVAGGDYTNAHTLFLLCDARSGKPLSNEPLHFAELSGGKTRDENRKWQDGAYQVEQHVDGRTDEQGCYIFEEQSLDTPERDLHVLSRLDAGQPLVAISESYSRRYGGGNYSLQDPFITTDRPIYRPGDVGHIKLWTGCETNRITLEISQDRSKQKLILSDAGAGVVPDAYGGAQIDFSIPSDAPLGKYDIKEMFGEHGFERSSLRVEQYRAPEFEVSVHQLDDGRIEIQSEYAYGAPVSGGKVRVDVRFFEASASPWYPPAAFDGVWSPGYWWHGDQFNLEKPVEYYDWEGFDISAEGVLDANGRFVVDLSDYEGGAEALTSSGNFRVSAEVTDAAKKEYSTSERFANNLQELGLCCWMEKAFCEPSEFLACNVDSKNEVSNQVVIIHRISGTNSVLALRRKVVDGKANLGRMGPGLYEARACAERELDSNPFRFFVMGTETQLTPDMPIRVTREKGVYQSGDTASILLQVDQPGRYVYFFERVTGGATFNLPQVVYMDQASKRILLPIKSDEAGKLSCAAMTIVDGKSHVSGCTIPVTEGSKQAGTISMVTDKPVYRPGATVRIDLQALDAVGEGKPCSIAISVYNRMLDTIAGEFPRQRGIYDALFSPWQYNLWRRFDLQESWSAPTSPEIPDWVMQSLDSFTVYAKSEKRFTPAGSSADDLFGDSGSVGFSMPEISGAMGGLGRSQDVAYCIADNDGHSGPLAVSIREDFRDAVYWNALVETDAEGRAQVEFPVPDSLTEWKIMAWAMHTNYAASGEASFKCAKDIVLQLNTPRFMVAGDELEISGSLRNHSTNALDAVAGCSASGAAVRVESVPEIDVQSLEAGAEKMLYWTMAAVTDGVSVVTVAAQSGTGSDGMAKPLPVLPHGMLKRGGRSGVLAGERREERVWINIPEAIDPASLRLELNCTPNMLESVAAALPYLADYPHGCTEQTLNRFLPSVVVLQTLEKTGLNLDGLTAALPDDRKAVYDRSEIIKRAQAGIDKLQDAQSYRGWWGWNLGSAYEQQDELTSFWVLRGLHMAAEQPGLSVDKTVIAKGVDKMVDRMVALMQPVWRQRKAQALTNTDVMLALAVQEVGIERYVTNSRDLKKGQEALPRFVDYLCRNAAELSLYGKVVLAYVCELRGEHEKRDELMAFIGQYQETDPALGTCRLRTGSANRWCWYNDAIEIQAWYLKLLNRVEPDSTRTAGVARYLMINRQYGDHWKSTRDTAICIEALCEFVTSHRPQSGDPVFEVLLNGVPGAVALVPGKNELLLKTDGRQPLFYDATWQYYTRENPISAEHCDLVSVSRTYFRLDAETGTRLTDPLAPGAELKAGETVEVQLTLHAAQALEYVLVQDAKPAGFECVETESKWHGGRPGYYQELHNEKVSFYINRLPEGDSTMHFRMRAEHAGSMSALPATVELMYAPDQAANSNESKLQVRR